MVARRTFDHHKVILILREVGRSFCTSLSGTIITHDMQQRIQKADTDAAALGHIRKVCFASFEIKCLCLCAYVQNLSEVCLILIFGQDKQNVNLALMNRTCLMLFNSQMT